MSNALIGNVYWIHEAGYINEGAPMKVRAIGFYGKGGTSQLLLTVAGTPVYNVIQADSGTVTNDLGGVWLESLSAATVVSCTGWLYLV